MRLITRWLGEAVVERFEERAREEVYQLLYSQLYMDLARQLERKMEEIVRVGKIPAKRGRRKIGKQKRLKLRRRRVLREKHK